MKRILTRILAIILVLYMGSCAYLYFFQRSILYLPDKNMEAPAEYGLPQAESLKIKTADNITLTAWYIKPKSGMPTLVYFHGNRGNLGLRIKKFTSYSHAGFGIFAISYRGFGTSEGKPTEEGLYNDARAAINYVISQGVSPNDIILYGESLGSGVAVQMATEQNFRAVILEAPYDTISARAEEIYPIFPVKLILKDKFASIDKIGKIHSPLLIFHSKDDLVMPFRHGEKLFAAAPEPKKMQVFENAGHSHFDWDKLAQIMLEFTKAKNNTQ